MEICECKTETKACSQSIKIAKNPCQHLIIKIKLLHLNTLETFTIDDKIGQSKADAKKPTQ